MATEKKTETTTAAKITKLLVIDRAGNGFSVLWTVDGITWIGGSRKPVNAAERDRALESLRRYASPDIQERHIEDFYGRIPQDWMHVATRVI